MVAMEGNYRHPGRAARAGLWIVIGAMIAGLALLVTSTATEDRPWAPLHGYQEQLVEERTIVTTPAGRPSINVIGTKCARQPVDVSGVMSWSSVDPPGRVVQVGPYAYQAPKGCTTSRFNNDIPSGVIGATVEMGGSAVWQLVGVEQAIDAGRTQSATWRTQQVTIRVTPPPFPPPRPRG